LTHEFRYPKIKLQRSTGTTLFCKHCQRGGVISQILRFLGLITINVVRNAYESIRFAHRPLRPPRDIPDYM
ncbi:MAG: hypothetical protein KDB00_21180, partial [Planctomycetales bacterium]|nr:hypothetical protein [Planctomycetales bacterium]